RSIVQKNDNLRKQLEDIRTELNTTFAPASIGISPNTGFMLEITGSTGELSLDAWLDDNRHLFFQDQPVHDREPTLQFTNNFGFVGINGSLDACKGQPEVKDKLGCFFTYVYPGREERRIRLGPERV